MIENDPVNNPSHYTNAPFECFELTREYPFAGGNAIKYVFPSSGEERCGGPEEGRMVSRPRHMR